uniref:Progestin and adipoQ receptor family member 3 n=1 Tax=Panagrolaimus sp. PS1159 TaxID=55785 RepID=A0AC35ESG4_9BILA
MTRCHLCRHGHLCRQHRRYKLVHRDTLKPCMWLNEHIHTAYRPAKITARMCFESIFSWNNETINIWSHFIGFIYFTWIQIHNMFVVLPGIGATSNDYIMTFLAVFGSQLCMALSAGYHTFGCINSRTRKTWLRADVFGISAGLLGMYLGGIYTSFYCFPDIQNTYLLGLLVILFITLYIPARKDSLTKRFGNTRIGYLHVTYILITAFGLYPTSHWISLHGGLDHPHVAKWLPNIFLLFSLIGLAFIFYATLIPERFSPGRFDYIGCSHQWWHLLILMAMIFWHSAGIDLLTQYHTDADSCSFATIFNEGKVNETVF